MTKITFLVDVILADSQQLSKSFWAQTFYVNLPPQSTTSHLENFSMKLFLLVDLQPGRKVDA